MDKHEKRIQGLMRCNLSRKEAEAQANTERSIVKLTKAQMFDELCEMVEDWVSIDSRTFDKKYIDEIVCSGGGQPELTAIRHFKTKGTTIKTGKV